MPVRSQQFLINKDCCQTDTIKYLIFLYYIFTLNFLLKKFFDKRNFFLIREIFFDKRNFFLIREIFFDKRNLNFFLIREISF